VAAIDNAVGINRLLLANGVKIAAQSVAEFLENIFCSTCENIVQIQIITAHELWSSLHDV